MAIGLVCCLEKNRAKHRINALKRHWNPLEQVQGLIGIIWNTAQSAA